MSRPSTSKRKTTAPIRADGDRGASCADFIAGDQVTHYGFTADDLERLTDKVLAFLQAGAVFAPRGEQLRAEANGEALVFHAGAALQLASRRDLRSYLLSLMVRRERLIWVTRFIPLTAPLAVKHAIERLDIPLAFSEFRIPRTGEGLEARLTTAPLADITTVLNKYQTVVILGEPGAGKTTTLQNIACERARTILSGGDSRVPLFVRLSQQGRRSPLEFLQAEWEQRTGLDFADALMSGRVLLLADGLDEVPRDERAERLKVWQFFTADYGAANQLVFSGRGRDGARQVQLPCVRVEPLDDERIAAYLQRNDARDLVEMLGDPRTPLHEMARNPFNLSLLAAAYKANQRELSNRGRLLEWFVDSLFSREEKLAHPGWLPRDVQTQALQGLAYTMQNRGDNTTFTVKTTTAALPGSVVVDGEDVPVTASDLLRCARSAMLIDPAPEQDVRFSHHLLQEYFAALELLHRFDDGEDLRGLWKCQRTIAEMPPAVAGEWDPLPEPPASGWEETTLLACGLARDPDKFIEAIRAFNPVLAGRCLDEAGLVNLADENPLVHYSAVAVVAPRVRDDLLADVYDPDLHLRARLEAGFTLGRIGDPRFQPQIINGVKVIVPQLVNVPAGHYPIGSASRDTAALDKERPSHSVDLPAFAIGKWPVTNAEFKCFLDAGGYHTEEYWTTGLARRWLRGEDVMGGPFAAWLATWRFLKSTPRWKEQLESAGTYSPDQLKVFDTVVSFDERELKAWLSQSLPGKSREQPAYWNDADRNNPAQPVVGITWFEANAYCAWLSAVTGHVYRLPTEVEWEAAARGSRGNRYPWGDKWDASRANTLAGRVLKPSPVGAYAAAGGVGPFGAEDQAGNVWNWTSTIYRPYLYRADDREASDAAGERVIRGGSWIGVHRLARCASRGHDVPDNFNDDVGFRLVSSGFPYF